MFLYLHFEINTRQLPFVFSFIVNTPGVRYDPYSTLNLSLLTLFVDFYLVRCRNRPNETNMPGFRSCLLDNRMADTHSNEIKRTEGSQQRGDCFATGCF